jgi:hypothetical protein
MSHLKQERSDGGDAFIPESAQVSGTSDGMAELLAEQYLRDASGDECEDDTRDEEVSEELGGPFVETRPDEEFGASRAEGPRPATGHPLRNPLPQAVGPLAVAAPDEDVADETASDGRKANLASETGSSMEPDIKIDSPASVALKT